MQPGFCFDEKDIRGEEKRLGLVWFRAESAKLTYQVNVFNNGKVQRAQMGYVYLSMHVIIIGHETESNK